MPQFFKPRKSSLMLKRPSARASKLVGKREYHTSQKVRTDQPELLLRKFNFNSRDYSNLCFDKYKRFQSNSPIIGNAVLHYNGEEVTASQYEMPSSPENAPQWLPLVDIQQVHRYGTTGYRAQTLDGVTLFSNRGYKFTDWNNRIHEIRPFSLHTSAYQEPYWGSSRLFSLTETPPDEQFIRGGNKVQLEPDTIATRTTRAISQNSVMHYSALQAFRSFHIEYGEHLTAEMDIALRRIINADYRGSTASKFYPEWHHAVGHSLAPAAMNPQEKSNLGGGPRWSNTMMMVFENLCRWHATQNPEVDVAITPTFFMLFASDLIEKIHYEALLSHQQRQIKFSHIIEPLRQVDPIIPQASDVAQITGITQALFTNVVPHCITKVPKVDSKTIESLTTTGKLEPFNQSALRL